MLGLANSERIGYSSYDQGVSGPDESEVAVADPLDTSDAGPLALRGSLLRLAGYAGTLLLALVAVPLIARHLHRIGYGRYTLSITIATIGVSLSEGGLSLVALREYTTRSGNDRERVLANLLGIRILLGGLSIAAAVAFAAVAGYGATVVLATGLAAFGLAAQVSQTVIATPLQADLRFGWVAAADLLRQGVATVLVVALVLAGADLVALVAVLIPASVSALVLTRQLVARKMPRRPRFDLSTSLPLLRDTVPFAVAVALGVTYFRLTVLLVSLIAGPTQLGIFSYSFRVVEALIFIPSIVIGAAYPILSRAAIGDPARFAYAARRIFELSVIAAVWLAIALELGSGLIVEVIGGHAAAPGAEVLRIQGLAVIGTFMASAIAFPTLALRGYRTVMFANACGLLVTLGLGLSMIPSLGARGGAIATVGGELALVVVNAVALSRSSPGLRLPLGSIPAAAFAGAAGLGVGYLVGVEAILDVLVATTVYAATLALFGRFPPEVFHVFQFRRGDRAPTAS
jgi:O-antigen/teichoic acid export membrane protein